MLIYSFGGAGRSQAPPTIKQVLDSFGIPQNQAALVRALGDQRSIVRRFAAAELAEIKSSQSSSSIEAALHKERDVTTQLALAEALISLGDDVGYSTLSDICLTSSAFESDRIGAAVAAGPKGESECIRPLLSISRSSIEPAMRVGAASYFKTLPKISGPLREDVAISMAGSLKDEDTTVRQTAGEVIARVRTAINRA